MRLGTGSIDQLSPKELKVSQDLDPVIGPIKQALEAGRVPVRSNTDPPDVVLLSQESSKLELKDGILHRVKKSQTGREIQQLVLPERYRIVGLRALHDECGHLGVERTAQR